MKILILGGIGPLTTPIVTSLTTWGHTVAFCGDTNFASKFPPAIEIISGQLDTLTEQRSRIDDFAAEVVVVLNPASHNIAHQSIELFGKPQQRLVLVSSSEVYRAFARFDLSDPGEPDLVPLLEDDPIRSANDQTLGQQLARIEQMYREAVNLSLTVVRLPTLFGPGINTIGFSKYLAQMDAGVTEIKLNQGVAEWRCATGYASDMANAIALSAKNSKAAGKTYNVADSFAFSQLDWVKAIARAAKWDGQITIAPDEPEPPTHDYSQHLIVDSSKIRQDLGYNELTPINDAFEATVEYSRSILAKQ